MLTAQWGRHQLLLALIGVLIVTVVAAVSASGRFLHQSRLAVSYTGLNYYDPSPYFTHCPEWSWLEPSCYRDSLSQLESDLDFVNRMDLGRFLRIWISLDQLIRWNESAGFEGYQPGALVRVDGILRALAAHRIKADLVLLAYSRGSGWIHQFRPQALDGLHPSMRTGYLRAVTDFIQHVRAIPGEARTIAVVDLQTEPYYQLEQYFDSRSNLGVFRGCASDGVPDTSCVDRLIIHPWLVDLYQVAHAADPNLRYTFADTGRLLTTDVATQRYWISMYPVDVYDIHMYAPHPWLQASRWATALKLPKPWFAGEAGCGSGDTACTYNGAAAAHIDAWWLAHLRRYGAQAVLVESHVTLWSYPYGPRSQTLTPTGLEVMCTTQPRLPRCSLGRTR